jgi:serine phosphatase RsbU (regulator of sigma subunit)
MDVLRSSQDRTAAQTVEAIKSAVDAHRGGTPSNDDTTIVAVRITA